MLQKQLVGQYLFNRPKPDRHERLPWYLYRCYSRRRGYKYLAAAVKTIDLRVS